MTFSRGRVIPGVRIVCAAGRGRLKPRPLAAQPPLWAKRAA